MSHHKYLIDIDKNLDKLKKSNPAAYRQTEKGLKIISKHSSNALRRSGTKKKVRRL